MERSTESIPNLAVMKSEAQEQYRLAWFQGSWETGERRTHAHPGMYPSTETSLRRTVGRIRRVREAVMPLGRQAARVQEFLPAEWTAKEG